MVFQQNICVPQAQKMFLWGQLPTRPERVKSYLLNISMLYTINRMRACYALL